MQMLMTTTTTLTAAAAPAACSYLSITFPVDEETQLIHSHCAS